MIKGLKRGEGGLSNFFECQNVSHIQSKFFVGKSIKMLGKTNVGFHIKSYFVQDCYLAHINNTDILTVLKLFCYFLVCIYFYSFYVGSVGGSLEHNCFFTFISSFN